MNQTIWIGLWLDHHSDPGVKPFASEEGAIAWARENGQQYCNRFGDFQEQVMTPSMQKQGWVFYGTYGDGDSIRVERKELLP